MPKKQSQISNGQIVIYTPRAKTRGVEVKIQQDTVWLTQKQMAELFLTGRSTITRHINNTLKTKELRKSSVCAIFAHTAEDGKTYNVNYYNLDMIISVGYRVNSRQGVQFRIWATNLLREYLIKGYLLNEKRLKERTDKLKDLQKTTALMKKLIQERRLSLDETSGLLHVITDYSYAITTLKAYDHKALKTEQITSKKGQSINYLKAANAISLLKKELIKKKQATSLFGKEREKNLLDSSLNAIYLTFDGKELYPSIEEKAANLLYFIVKNHPFIDGNKRIGAFIFIWFLSFNKLLYSKEGRKRIADNALISLTLLVAESKPKDKDIVINLIVNLINKRNK